MLLGTQVTEPPSPISWGLGWGHETLHRASGGTSWRVPEPWNPRQGTSGAAGDIFPSLRCEGPGPGPASASVFLPSHGLVSCLPGKALYTPSRSCQAPLQVGGWVCGTKVHCWILPSLPPPLHFYVIEPFSAHKSAGIMRQTHK